MELNLGLENAALYKGTEIENVNGRLNLITPMAEALPIIGRNLTNILEDEGAESFMRPVILTGPMAIPVYLVVFHQIVHKFPAVWYRTTRETLVICKHG